MVGIYMIKCLSNGKCYIGKANDVLSRERQHFSKLRTGNHPVLRMQEDYNKYGCDNFKFSILEECTEDKLNHLEDYYILSNHTVESGYNSKRGDVVSLSCEDFDYVEEFNWMRKINNAKTQSNTTFRWLCLQLFINDLNELGKSNYSISEYLKGIKDKDTKFYIEVDRLSGRKPEEISVDNVIRLYDKYVIYVESAKIPQEYIEYKNNMIQELRNRLNDIMNMVINPNLKYEKYSTLEDALLKHEGIEEIIIRLEDGGLDYRNSNGTFYLYEGDNFNDNDDITSSLVEMLMGEDCEWGGFALFIAAIERKMTLTLNDVLNMDLKPYISII
jgi:uncharacterized protein (UPF0305 family)